MSAVSSNRVYQYGLLPPTEGASVVHAQMRLAHRYYNDLVAIERGRLNACRALMSTDYSVAEAEAARDDALKRLDEARAASKAARIARRTRDDSPEMRDAVASAKADLARASLLVSAAKMTAKDTLRSHRHALDLVKSCRAYSGVYWGTYTLVEAAVEAASKSTRADGGPWHKRWDGSGQVGMYIQGGADLCDIVGTGNQIQWPEYVEGTRVAQRTSVRLRIQSDERGGPVWATWPMVYHRPLPEGARFKRAVVTLRRRGRREEWTLEVTVDMSACAPRRARAEGSCVLHVGWRADSEGVRVGTWLGSDGATGTIVCPMRVLTGLEKSESLRSIRDRAQDAMKATLLSQRDGWPEWLRTETETMHSWKSPARFASLARRWRARGVDEAKDSYEVLEAWRYQDEHLWRWEHDQRLNSERHRREVYRVAVARLADRYARLVLSDSNWAEMAELPEAGEGPHALPDEARAQRVAAAPSRLVEAAKSAFRDTVFVSAQDLTRTCTDCGNVEDGDGFVRACSRCGARRDIDTTAAQLMAERERSGAWSYSRTARKDDESSKIREVRTKKWATRKARK